MTGRKFGRLTVIGGPISRRLKNNTRRFWECLCDCGNKVQVSTDNLNTGNTKSCGCYKRERIRKSRTIHGEATQEGESKEYRIWKSAKVRCYNSNRACAKNYKNRGISMCSRWRKSFANFLEDMGRCPQNFTLERKDNNKGYWPENCKWASRQEQNRNRRDNIWIQHKGKRTLLVEAAETLGVSYNWLYWRVVVKGVKMNNILREVLKERRYNNALTKTACK